MVLTDVLMSSCTYLDYIVGRRLLSQSDLTFPLQLAPHTQYPPPPTNPCRCHSWSIHLHLRISLAPSRPPSITTVPYPYPFSVCLHLQNPTSGRHCTLHCTATGLDDDLRLGTWDLGWNWTGLVDWTGLHLTWT